MQAARFLLGGDAVGADAADETDASLSPGQVRCARWMDGVEN